MKRRYLLLAGLLLSAAAWAQAPPPTAPTQPAPPSVTIVGAVKMPGVYAFKFGRPIGMRQLIALAGNFSNIARADEVQILRVRKAAQPGAPEITETIQVDLKRIMRDAARPDIALEPGDVVVVPPAPGTRPKSPLLVDPPADPPVRTVPHPLAVNR